MKSASLICASVIVLALCTAGSALAAGTPIGTAPGTTAADCIAKGGTVAVDSQGNKVCKPKAGPMSLPGREPPN